MYLSGIYLIYKVRPENACGSNIVQLHTVQIMLSIIFHDEWISLALFSEDL